MKAVLLKGMVFFACLLPLMSQAAEDAPRQTVEQTSMKMTHRLLADKEMVQSEPQYVEQLVDELLLPVVDHVYMAKRVLGKHWKRASKDQQKTFVRAFKQKVIRTYAGAFKAFNGETIRFEDSRMNKNGRQAFVKSEIERIGATNIRVDYKLYHKKGNWKVFDVIIEGVSLVKSFRDQVAISIEKDGLAKAISKLADEYESGAPLVKLGGQAWEPYLGTHLPNNGLVADIVRSAFSKAGYQLSLSFSPYKKLSEKMDSGELDGSIAIWFSPERADQVLFSSPYLENRLIFIKRDNDPFFYQTPQQLSEFTENKRYRLGIFNDFSYSQQFNRIRPMFEIEERNYCSQLFRDVASKKLDLALVDHWVATAELGDKKHIADHLSPASGVLETRNLHIAISQQHPQAEQIIKAFNHGLELLKADGSYQALLKQHRYPQI